MLGVNKVIVLGLLGAEPEIRYTNNGDAVANLRVATSERWKDRESGETKERTEWHTVVLYGRLAEIAGQYLTKGQAVYVEGSLRTRTWEDRDGTRRYRTEVIGATLQMLGGGASGKDTNGDDGDDGDDEQRTKRAQPPRREAPKQQRRIDVPQRRSAPTKPERPIAQEPGEQVGSSLSDIDDDIPF